METTDSNITLVIVACVAIPALLLCAGIMFAIAYSASRKVAATRRWSSAWGRIVRSTFKTEWVSGDDGGSFQALLPDIVYEYQVNGQVYYSDKLIFGVVFKSSSPKSAQNMLAKYPLGAVVPIYYNPTAPMEAILEPHAPANKLYWGLFWLFIGLLGLVICMIALFSTFLRTP